MIALREHTRSCLPPIAISSRNEGATMGTGQKLWKRAKRVIPGGNMLLSKRAEMFLPEQWPAYFSSAKGCRVWDLDGNEYIDMSIMGIGTNTLGYGHPEVDDAVRRTVAAGNMSTLNCPEEVYLAERLVELHPWATWSRFARSGGEANAIAIRIARAASGPRQGRVLRLSRLARLVSRGQPRRRAEARRPPAAGPRAERRAAGPARHRAAVQLQQPRRARSSSSAITTIGVIMMEVARNIGPEHGFPRRGAAGSRPTAASC